MVNVRALALLLLALLGCKGSDRISDRELRREGAFTTQDAAARELLRRSRRANPAELERLPLRRATGLRKFVDPFEVLGVTLPAPDLSAALGFDFQESAWVLPSQNAIIILHDGQPPTILPIDPDRPITGPETDERVYQRLRQTLQDDLRGLPPAPPVAP